MQPLWDAAVPDEVLPNVPELIYEDRCEVTGKTRGGMRLETPLPPDTAFFDNGHLSYSHIRLLCIRSVRSFTNHASTYKGIF